VSGREIVTDSIPPAIYISLADLPALLSGNIVGITLEQMDSLTVDMIQCDAAKEALVMYQGKLDTAYVEILKRDFAISECKALDQFYEAEIGQKNILIDHQSVYIRAVERDLKRQRRKTTFAWIAGGVVTGILSGIIISR